MTVKIVRKLGNMRDGYTEILYFDAAGNFCAEDSAFQRSKATPRTVQ